MKACVPLVILAAVGAVGCGSRTEPGGPSGQDAAATDGGLPGLPVDASPGCADGGPLELVYALDDLGVLHRYDPLTGQRTPLGTPACADGNVQWTFTASRDRGFILYTDGALFTVDLTTLACAPTPFQPGQLGLDTESGFAAVGSGASERLYFYGLASGGGAPILAVCDTTSYILTPVGAVTPAPPSSA